ncbi:hypothetical protein ACIRU8_39505 [Streptomyces sp. NPDC101175]|uniref:hypothetical protein n=1 Tax=Streptomyces sp. NPDC101175 TaxID=3366123 RepID=UPI0038354A97
MSEIKAGQIWRSDTANAFFLIAEDGGHYSVGTFRVEPHPEQGYWRPVPGKEEIENTPEGWLTTYARPYDRVERWLFDGPRLVSIDPHRYFDLPGAA